MYKVQVKTPGDKDWVGNQMEFSTLPDAHEYAINLFMRWTLVQQWRIIGPKGDVVMEYPQ